MLTPAQAQPALAVLAVSRLPMVEAGVDTDVHPVAAEPPR
jgi:hypothetical protein